MEPLLTGLLQLGVRTLSMRGDGYAPVILHGPLIGGKARILGTDSQPVSALLIASSLAPHPTELIIDQPGETPWVDLTLHWLATLGAQITHHNFSHYSLRGNLRYEGFEYTVPGDLSSAAYPLAAALITDSELLLHNVDLTDIQGDKETIFLLQQMGAQLEIDPVYKTLRVKKGSQLKGITADINPTIDALPLLAVVACYAQGETHLYNGSIARHKECNRLASITTELAKMGALISETHDGLKIQGAPLQGADLHSYHDHRLALSLCVAALGASGTTQISPWGCTAKTFPSFLPSLQRLGAQLQ
jgi:3-phosphoshikimate 1-carboxyvinyltransferase